VQFDYNIHAVYNTHVQCAAVCCSVSQCVAVCRSLLQCVAVCCTPWHLACSLSDTPPMHINPQWHDSILELNESHVTHVDMIPLSRVTLELNESHVTHVDMIPVSRVTHVDICAMTHLHVYTLKFWPFKLTSPFQNWTPHPWNIWTGKCG